MGGILHWRNRGRASVSVDLRLFVLGVLVREVLGPYLLAGILRQACVWQPMLQDPSS